MKTHNPTSLILAALLAATYPVSTFAQVSGDAVPTREDSVLISMEAEVVAINHDTREVTLADGMGRQTTIVAGEQVKRLGEVSVGDLVEVDYYLSIAAEFRAPTEDEMAEPIQFVEGAGRAESDEAPGGGALRMIKAVCVVEGLDRPSETVTLMGPLGGLNVVRVADVDNLTKMKIGDTIVVTFTEALAVSLEKVEE